MTPQEALTILRNIIHAYVADGEEYDQAHRALLVLERYRNPDAEALAALVTFVVDIEHDARRALNGLVKVAERTHGAAVPALGR